ncbi:MAG TPA: hypothetical protein VGB55_03780 [Tepidisphaeraceae bacterium]|jgi:ABC-type branched-subunit amino acid transport system ATPase component
MIDEFKQILDQIRTLPDAEKATMQTWLIVTCVMSVVYYLVAGVVVWALGRRIIQGSFAALREARRTND